MLWTPKLLDFCSGFWSFGVRNTFEFLIAQKLGPVEGGRCAAFAAGRCKCAEAWNRKQHNGRHAQRRYSFQFFHACPSSHLIKIFLYKTLHPPTSVVYAYGQQKNRPPSRWPVLRQTQKQQQEQFLCRIWAELLFPPKSSSHICAGLLAWNHPTGSHLPKQYVQWISYCLQQYPKRVFVLLTVAEELLRIFTAFPFNARCFNSKATQIRQFIQFCEFIITPDKINVKTTRKIISSL